MTDNARSAAADMAALQQCLPIALQAPTTAITRIAAGMSGAGVYRVEAGDEHFVLKTTSPDEPVETWRNKTQVQQLAAVAGIAPRIIHVDESRRAVLSELIVDRSFPAQFSNPVTREAAIVTLGQMLRELHALPIPGGLERVDAKGFLQTILNSVPPDFALPAFVRHAMENLLAELPPASSGALVLSHNDVNPTNLVFDGARLLLLDWQATAPNDAYYDLAAIAMFFRMDDDTARKLIAAHNDAPVDVLPDVFTYYRRFVAVLSGAAMLHIARLRGHAGGDIAEEMVSTLGDVYQQLQHGALDMASVSGQWTLGLSLVKEGVTGTGTASS